MLKAININRVSPNDLKSNISFPMNSKLHRMESIPSKESDTKILKGTHFVYKGRDRQLLFKQNLPNFGFYSKVFSRKSCVPDSLL